MKERSGLEGVVVAETRLSRVDGEAGELVFCGFTVEELALNHSFESLLGLFLDGVLPNDARSAEIQVALGEGRLRAFEGLERTGDALLMEDGMDALRAGASHMVSDALGVIAALPVIASAWARKQQGSAPVQPDPKRGHAADYLTMLGGTPGDAEARGLERYLCTVMDHGMNASTFTARVIASTESDVVSGVVGALGALKGRLHGGAPGPVLDMFDEIEKGKKDEPIALRARRYIEAQLEQRQRIMGMGHRVYRVRDPRAAVLEKAARALLDAGAAKGRVELAHVVEREAEALLAQRYPGRPLKANVEFYTAVLLEALGLPRSLFTPTFAISRVVGWCAHMKEQRQEGRLIRPKARYVGP